jgi:hypothetical protein
MPCTQIRDPVRIDGWPALCRLLDHRAECARRRREKLNGPAPVVSQF